MFFFSLGIEYFPYKELFSLNIDIGKFVGLLKIFFYAGE